LATIISSYAIFSFWYLDSWRYLTSDIATPFDFGQGLGILSFFLIIFINPIGLFAGSGFGYIISDIIEKRIENLPKIWLLLLTIGFSLLLIIGLTMLLLSILGQH